MLDGPLRRSVPSLRCSRRFRMLTLSFMPREMLLRGPMLLRMHSTFLLMPTLCMHSRFLRMVVMRHFARARLLGAPCLFRMRRPHALLFAFAIATFERCSRFLRTFLLSRMSLLAAHPLGLLLSLSAYALRFCHPRVFTRPRRMRSFAARTLD
jgi:hypothetical protein